MSRFPTPIPRSYRRPSREFTGIITVLYPAIDSGLAHLETGDTGLRFVVTDGLVHIESGGPAGGLVGGLGLDGRMVLVEE